MTRKSASHLSPATIALVVCLSLLPAAGCRSKTKEMSKYPYFVTMMDERWDIAMGTVQAGQTNIFFCPVLLKDLSGMADTMEVNYFGPNRDEAIAGIRDISRTFYADLSTQVDMTRGSVVLLPGITAEQVGQSMSKAHQKYVEVRKLIKM